MTQMLNVTHQSPAYGLVPDSRIRPLVRRSLITTLAASALIGSVYAPAFAEDSEPATTVANVVVGSVIAITGLTPDFTLTGLPGETVTTGETPVAYTVTTNNAAGYIVTIQAQTDLLAQTPGNADFIPIGALSAGDDTTPGGLQVLSTADPVTVHTASARTAEEGDALTTNFSVDIPFVNTDTYSAALDYVASTL